MTSSVALDQHMTGHHRHTYEAIFRHPVAHNLEWHDVRSLLDAVATVTEKHDGFLEVKRNGQMINLHIPKHKDAPIELVLDIRRFLEASGMPENTATTVAGIDLLVVIDHQDAKVYRVELYGTAPQKLVPYDPHGFRRCLASVGTGRMLRLG